MAWLFELIFNTVFLVKWISRGGWDSGVSVPTLPRILQLWIQLDLAQ
jgi:hypothetical protein